MQIIDFVTYQTLKGLGVDQRVRGFRMLCPIPTTAGERLLLIADENGSRLVVLDPKCDTDHVQAGRVDSMKW